MNGYYQLCIRDSECKSEIVLYYKLDELEKILADIKYLQSRSNERLCFEFFVE